MISSQCRAGAVGIPSPCISTEIKIHINDHVKQPPLQAIAPTLSFLSYKRITEIVSICPPTATGCVNINFHVCHASTSMFVPILERKTGTSMEWKRLWIFWFYGRTIPMEDKDPCLKDPRLSQTHSSADQRGARSPLRHSSK
jgi:hypothetical protein